MDFFELLEKGGFVMFVIVILSVYSFAVIIYKIFQFWQLKVYNTSFLEDLLKEVSKKNINNAKKIAQNNLGVIARVIELSLNTFFSDQIEFEKGKGLIAAFGSSKIRILERHLKGLEMVANVSPLLGLLGTVIGMVDSFSSIEKAGKHINPSILAGGIWEALITTVAGLVAAIPALIAYYFIENKIEDIKSTIRDSINEIIAYVK